MWQKKKRQFISAQYKGDTDTIIKLGSKYNFLVSCFLHEKYKYLIKYIDY